MLSSNHSQTTGKNKIKAQPYLAYVSRPSKKQKNSRSREARGGGSRDKKFRSGEQSLNKNTNVTHNNIITANNVIINYGGGENASN